MEIACTGVILSVFYNVTRSLQIRYSKRHVANRNFYRWLWHTTFSIECHLNREKFVEFKETLKKKIDAILIKIPNTKKNIFFKISFCFNCFHTKIYFSLGFSQVQKVELIKKHIYIYFFSIASISTLLYTQTSSMRQLQNCWNPTHFNNPCGGESSERLNPIIRRLIWLGGGGRWREMLVWSEQRLMPFKMHEE